MMSRPHFPRPNVDVASIHRDLANYYRMHGLLDTSTAEGLFDRAVWPNIVSIGRPVSPISFRDGGKPPPEKK